MRSGISRVARSIARAFTERYAAEYRIALCGPLARLHEIGAGEWAPGVRLVNWEAGRHSLRAEVAWGRVRREVGEAVWYFPNWDAPWHSLPERSIITIHDLALLTDPATSWHRRMVARRWMTRSARRAARIAVVSEGTRRDVVATWPDLKAKTAVVPNGVDARFFGEPPALPSTLRDAIGRKPFMLSVGIRKRYKNLLAGVRVLEQLPDIRWVVLGEWFRDWDDVERRAKASGVFDRMIVLPQQSDAVLHALYAASACLFFPSRREGFGLPPLEALACGTRVVASDIEAVRAVVNGFAELCAPDDVACFTSAVQRAVSARTPADPAARDHAHAFTWEKSASILAALIDEIAAPPGSASSGRA